MGSFAPDGAQVIDWVLDKAPVNVAFYDIDTPVTLGKLRSGDAEYLRPEQVERFDLYLSFTAGSVLDSLSSEFGARRPEPFYCFVDPRAYPPLELPARWSLNYLGTYSAARQPAVDECCWSRRGAFRGRGSRWRVRCTRRRSRGRRTSNGRPTFRRPSTRGSTALPPSR